jgi:hypothetical protein
MNICGYSSIYIFHKQLLKGGFINISCEIGGFPEGNAVCPRGK